MNFEVLIERGRVKKKKGGRERENIRLFLGLLWNYYEFFVKFLALLQKVEKHIFWDNGSRNLIGIIIIIILVAKCETKKKRHHFGHNKLIKTTPFSINSMVYYLFIYIIWVNLIEIYINKDIKYTTIDAQGVTKSHQTSGTIHPRKRKQ